MPGLISLLGFFIAILSFPSASVARPSLPKNFVARADTPNDGGYYFTQAQDILRTMQATYWNATYWPTSSQWIGAFLGTLLAASDRSLTNALVEYNGQVPKTSSNADTVNFDISVYYNEINAYYDDEDTNQIFGAAFDDAQWVVLEWLEVIKFISSYDAFTNSDFGQADIAKFAHRAHIFYNIVQNQFDTSLCGGGLTWDPKVLTYKNAITNELFVSSSMAMYLYFPGDDNTDPNPSTTFTGTLPPLPSLAAHDPLLLQNAQNEWAWFKSQPFRNAQGLVIDGFHLSENQDTCDQPSEAVFAYNQGVMLSGLRQLWEATGDTSYLDDAYDQIWSAINATGWFALTNGGDASAWAGLGRNGIMEDACDADNSCNQDQRMFKGIFFHHLDAFCEPLPTQTALIPGLTVTAPADLAASHSSKCVNDYLPWIEHNAQAAIATKDGSNIIGNWWGAPNTQATDTRDVQTQAGGLGVVKAASDLLLQRPPQYPST